MFIRLLILCCSDSDAVGPSPSGRLERRVVCGVFVPRGLRTVVLYFVFEASGCVSCVWIALLNEWYGYTCETSYGMLPPD